MIERVRGDGRWRYRELSTGHDAMITAPRELVDLLLEGAWAATEYRHENGSTASKPIDR